MNAIICYIDKNTTKSETSSKTCIYFIGNKCTDETQNYSAKSMLMKLNQRKVIVRHKKWHIY